ncbi:MAG: septation protein SpoVG family protein [Bacteroidaceae bacterium]|nr:septation protein SpoVG family protein [Bacteroidaceae bacterium]
MAKTTTKNDYKWEVSRGTMATKEGAVKMFGITASLSVNGQKVLDVNDISVIDGSKGTYVGLPQRSYKDKEGNTKFAKTVYMQDEDCMTALSDAVLAYFDEQ